ncbi:hypothetical protein ACFQ9R_28705 [Nocardia sp. NPDC056541]|uniref:hypothetical protein n=1 Tax=Nocardia sp. NPDC056541 TaxID=3345860 RepID=UPI00366D3BF3
MGAARLTELYRQSSATHLHRAPIERLAKLAGHVAALGAHLGKSVQTYNAVVGCMESRVLPQSRRVIELQGEETSIPELETVDLTLRQVTSTSTELDDDSPTAA